MVKKFSLKDLIDRVDWVTLNMGRTGTRLPDNACAVSFIKTKKDSEEAGYVRVRFGHKLLEELDWKQGDKISALHDRDDLMSFLLVKKEGKEGGRALNKEASSSVCAVQFKWNRELKLKPSASRIVEHEIYKGYVHFRLPSDD